MPQGHSDRPDDPQDVIDEQRRQIEGLREDLRRSKAERQRLCREDEELKEGLDAARRAVHRRRSAVAHVSPTRSGRVGKRDRL